jgi:hypothetical protein
MKGTKQFTVYIADDDTEHASEERCREYERRCVATSLVSGMLVCAKHEVAPPKYDAMVSYVLQWLIEREIERLAERDR